MSGSIAASARNMSPILSEAFADIQNKKVENMQILSDKSAKIFNYNGTITLLISITDPIRNGGAEN